ncbi:DUF1549 domain-containing protein [Lignipirellula cremea]|uniref:DUF1549 domain-containing protein n=1 Tax=Lignipirellula cremea TaxID=2528010 RepID=UPI001E51B318|nr:DUF1549 domain-containing protein [Lignipirellula cremea]
MLSVALTSWATAEPVVTGIAVYPPDVNLTSSSDRQTWIVVATRADGVTLDVTKETKASLADPALAKLEGNTLHPLADGTTQLDLEWNGHKASLPVVVANSAVTPPISFHLDVMPIFLRSGCNTGSCHGAARGKDGFRLSLFGFDPQGDYFRITREQYLRRVNLAVPADSLLVEKSIGAVPHTGGKRFGEDSEYYRTMVQWLEDGALNDEGEPPVVSKLEVYPPKAVLEGEGATQQFIARATYSDGTDRDVSSLALFQSNNDNSGPVDADGLVTASNRGEAFVMCRFETHTVGSQVLVLPADMDYVAPPVGGNYIDQLVGAKLQRLRMLPSEICTDEEFLRRVTIDVTGSLPTEEEYWQFVNDGDPNKRAALVDRLLERKEFSEIWAMKWAELLMIKSSNQVSYKSMFLYHSWLTDKVANNVPLDQMVRELLGATGGTFTEPATNYYQIETDTLKTAENVAQVFMGIRTQCAQCHNHPFDRWTMDDYYSFAAFFSAVGRKRGEDYRENIIYNRGGGDVKHPLDNRVMEPKFLGGETPDVKGKDRRVVMAEWLTSKENPYFSTSVANRVWAHFMGVGIVDQVDDIRVSNPASNPELFAELGSKLVEYNYDFRQLVRDICNSQAYQRSCVRNESNREDENNFAHAIVRRVPAEMMLDCINQVTNTKEKFKGLPLGSRAVQIADGNTSTYFLDTFGRAKRETVCSCEATTDPTLSQALHMINGSTVQGKISQGKLVKEMLAAGKTPEEVIESIYIRALCRRPTTSEVDALKLVVAAAETPEVGLEDVFWAVLNSREFVFSH